MLLTILYGLCGLSLGFIIGYWYGFDTHALLSHGKLIDNWAWFKRRIIGDGV